MSLSNEQVRAKLLDYCLGQLSDEEAAQIDRQLLMDGALAEEAQRVRDLLSTGRRADAIEWTPARAEANFAAIAMALGSVAEQPPTTGQVEAAAVAAISTGARARGRRWRPLAGFAAAAAAMLVLAGGLLRGDESAVRERSADVAQPEPTEIGSPSAEVAKPSPQAPDRDSWARLARVASRPPGFPGSVFASAEAVWRAQSDKGWTLYVGSGALLVEWMPAGDEHLIVRTPSETVEITGTVFAVEVTEEATEVSVVEGSVLIARTDDGATGERIGLDRAGRWQSVEGSTAISGAVQTAAGLRVDLAAHRAWMASRKQRRESARVEAAQPRRAETVAAVEPQMPLDRLADEALSVGDKPLAAALLEQWATQAPAPSTRRAAKLDLARIYLYELHQPERGAAHLRDLISSAPSDTLVSTLRSELCSLRLPKDATLCEAD